MDLQVKLTSLLKEKEEQEQIEQRARKRIVELNKLIKSAERLIKDAEEVFGPEPGTPNYHEVPSFVMDENGLYKFQENVHPEFSANCDTNLQPLPFEQVGPVKITSDGKGTIDLSKSDNHWGAP